MFIVTFIVGTILHLLAMFAELFPVLKKIEKSISCTFVEVDISKHKLKTKSEEGENKITYFRRFQKVDFFGGVDSNDWSTWIGWFRPTSCEPGDSFQFASLKKNSSRKSTTSYICAKLDIIYILHFKN